MFKPGRSPLPSLCCGQQKMTAIKTKRPGRAPDRQSMILVCEPKPLIERHPLRPPINKRELSSVEGMSDSPRTLALSRVEGGCAVRHVSIPPPPKRLRHITVIGNVASSWRTQTGREGGICPEKKKRSHRLTSDFIC